MYVVTFAEQHDCHCNKHVYTDAYFVLHTEQKSNNIKCRGASGAQDTVLIVWFAAIMPGINLTGGTSEGMGSSNLCPSLGAIGFVV